MKTCYIMVGPPGSGKTTWATTNCPEATRLVAAVPEGKVTLSIAKEAHKQLRKDLRYYLKRGDKEIVIDAFNYTSSQRTPLIRSAATHGYYVVLVAVPWETEACVARARGYIPEDVIRNVCSKIDLKPGVYSILPPAKSKEA